MARQLSIAAVCRLIDALLPKGYPTIDDIARLPRVSSRTLQRLLNEEGVSYDELVDRCRCKTAFHLLETTQKPIHDIASALGYPDTTSFSRAFRCWTGIAPSTYRTRHSQNKNPVRRSPHQVSSNASC